MKETGWRRGWESPVQPPFLQWLNNILHSELPWGEKGVPFHAEQGVVQEGPSRTFSSSYPHLFLFSRLFLLLFVSLIGLTDHRSLTYSPGGMLGSQEINTVAKERRAVGAKSSKVRLFSKHAEKW